MATRLLEMQSRGGKGTAESIEGEALQAVNHNLCVIRRCGDYVKRRPS